MTLRNHLLQPLFDATKSKEPISEEKLLEIRSLIRTVQTKEALGESISINEQDSNGYIALNDAISFHQIDIADELIKANADPNNKDTGGDAPPHCAAYNKNTKITQNLLYANADPNIQTNINKSTPLMIAVLEEEIVQTLIDAKANLNIINKDGDTALIIAARQSKLRTTQLLLKAGAKFEIQNNQKKTALDIAIELNIIKLKISEFQHELTSVNLTENLSIIHALLNHGALIHNPKDAFYILKRCDSRDPNVLDCLNHLYTQLEHGESKDKSPQTKFLLDEIKTHRDALSKLTITHQQVFIKEANLALQKFLPAILLNNILYPYCDLYSAPLKQLGLFKWNDILPEKKAPPAKRERICSVM